MSYVLVLLLGTGLGYKFKARIEEAAQKLKETVWDDQAGEN